MSSAVLDAPALLALLKGEPGGAKVAGVLAEAMISVVNLTEVVSHFAHLGMPVGEIENMLKALPLTLAAADAALAWGSRTAPRRCRRGRPVARRPLLLGTS